MENTLPIGDLEIKEEQKVTDVGILHQVIGRTLFRSVALDIENTHTEVIMSDYADKFMVIISQYPKLGTLFLVRRNFINDAQGKHAVYSTKVVFGAAGEEEFAAARYIGEIIQIDKPVVLFLNLHSYNAAMVKALKTLLDEFIYHEYFEVHDESEYRDYDPENPCGVDLRSLGPHSFWEQEAYGFPQENGHGPSSDEKENIETI